MFSVDQKWLVTIKNAPAVRYSSGDTYAADKKQRAVRGRLADELGKCFVVEALSHQPTSLCRDPNVKRRNGAFLCCARYNTFFLVDFPNFEKETFCVKETPSPHPNGVCVWGGGGGCQMLSTHVRVLDSP